ncbi:MAG: Tim44/TimA family putative adaptor protein [Alphaproteobacteria bacterium]|nr:Tim44/TimA family putative adaptor protein [Alphaproteobacteria bacterium]MBU1757087.1 Tim44/TimA family putative adaptor protein [Alphaproteobacteria bacterium]
MILEIVILAAVAAFLGLRLYSVLGRRAEHEEEVVPRRIERGEERLPGDDSARAAQPAAQLRQIEVPAGTEAGVRAIAAVDPRFDITSFLEGAKGAYGMILEAFWEGDRETLRELCDDDVYESFAGAIDAREAAGETLANRLVRIESATIKSAELDGRVARVAVLFVADIAAVTRDRDDTVIAGSLDDAVESRDIWTFARHVDSPEPNWILDETDQD